MAHGSRLFFSKDVGSSRYSAPVTSAAEHPHHAQLRILREAADRQGSQLLAKQGNLIARASLALAASGVAFALQVAASSWHLLPAVLSFAAGVFALQSTWLWASKATDVTKRTIREHLAYDPYSLEYGLVKDLYAEIYVLMADYKRKAAWLQPSYTLIGASALVSGLVAVLQSTEIL